MVLKLKTPLNVLKKRKCQLIKKPTFTQKKAEEIVKKVAGRIFRYKVQTERIIRPYILDIYIKNIKIGIEIDGGVHEKQGGYDNKRDQFLWEKHGIRVFRFNNKDITAKYFKETIWQVCIDGTYRYLEHIRERASDNNIVLPIDFPINKSLLRGLDINAKFIL